MHGIKNWYKNISSTRRRNRISKQLKSVSFTTADPGDAIDYNYVDLLERENAHLSQWIRRIVKNKNLVNLELFIDYKEECERLKKENDILRKEISSNIIDMDTFCESPIDGAVEISVIEGLHMIRNDNQKSDIIIHNN